MLDRCPYFTRTGSMNSRHSIREVLPILIVVWLLSACATGSEQPQVSSDTQAPATAEATPAPPDDAGASTPALPPENQAATPDASEPATSVTENTRPETAPEQTPPPEAEGSADQPSLAFDPNTTAIELVPIIEGLNQPLYVTHAADGSDRLFVIEKPGRILVYGPERSQGQVFLDIQDRVGSSGSEQGLLGLAFPPNYTESGHFFVNYTDLTGDTIVARFAVSAEDPNNADATSEFVVLTLAQPARNHNGGMLLFGSDGYLWIGTGDGGAGNDAFGNGQNPQTLLGAMLRIDVTSDPNQPYTIPADNPWIGETYQGQEVLGEIWAIGLRNPWRYSFDRATGDLWIADVGQNQYEEINQTVAAQVAEGGLNFGWPIMEGNHCFQADDCATEGLVLPVAEYDHSQGCSVTGGYVYRGEQFPVLDGVYFYADYCSGLFWAHWRPEGGDPQTQLMLQTGIQASSFGEDAAGELYVTDLSGGSVYQVQAQPE